MDIEQFHTAMALLGAAYILVLIDWYTLHRRYGIGLVDRLFAFLCLAMLAGNAIMVHKSEYILSMYTSMVIFLTEAIFIVNERVNK